MANQAPAPLLCRHHHPTQCILMSGSSGVRNNLCLLKKELQNFPRKSDIEEHHICKAFDPGNGNAIVIGMILILFPLVTS